MNGFLSMASQAFIYFRVHPTIPAGARLDLGDALPAGTRVGRARAWLCEGSTHEVIQRWPYYAPGAEQGPWPKIAAVLMALFASRDVECVWYFGGISLGDTEAPFTPVLLREFTDHYLHHAHRPWTERSSRRRGHFFKRAAP